MVEYKVFFKKSVWKDFKSIPKKDLVTILDLINAPGENPRPVNCTKLTGQEKYRIRFGKYGIVYSIQDNEFTVWVVKVGHRKHIYWR